MKYVAIYLVSTVCVIFLWFNFSPTVNAQEISWTQAHDVTIAELPNSEQPTADTSRCSNEKVRIGGSFGEEATVCIYYADGFRYALHTKYISNGWSGYATRSFVIGFDGDQAMYKVHGLNAYELPIYVPNSKDFVYRYYVGSSTWGSYMTIIKNLPSKLHRIISTNPTPVTEYEIAENASEYFIYNEEHEWTMTRSVGVSSNGEWMVVELRPGGLLRINMKTYEKKWFSQYSPRYGRGEDPTIEFAVSDDGSRVALAGVNTPTHVVEINDQCGQNITLFYDMWRSYPSVNGCPVKDFYVDIGYRFEAGVRSAVSPSFSYDGGELTVLVTPRPVGDKTFPERWMTIRAPGYTPPSMVYMALGDSYASGEGDTGKKDNGTGYYRSKTDEYPNTCHVSERSYPFLLQKHFNIAQGKMQSLACSGALVYADYARPVDNYPGQGRRLADKSPQERKKLQSEALDSFTPGWTPQIEFVKKYKPSVITISGGGNDVGFAEIIKYCASFQWEGLIIKDTCDYAKKDTELRKILGKTIQDQYYLNKRLLDNIKSVSPDSRIYVVGYPSFIAGSLANCALNSGLLDGEEREMINEGVSYLNNVLKQAADAAGAYYIDIEDSLYKGRLCEGSMYITGVYDKHFDMSGRSVQEMFHPNAMAHQKIAKHIINSGFNLLALNKEKNISIIAPPLPPKYFSDRLNATTSRIEIIKKEFVRLGEIVKVDFEDGRFMPDSEVTITAHSQPFVIGSFTANSKGGLNGSMIIPNNIDIGTHAIVLSAKSHSGEDLRYYQFTEIIGPENSDVANPNSHESIYKEADNDILKIQQQDTSLVTSSDNSPSMLGTTHSNIDHRIEGNMSINNALLVTIFAVIVVGLARTALNNWYNNVN